MATRPVLYRDARALRFLLLLLGGWMLVRAMAHWNPAPPPAGPLPSPWVREAPPPPWQAAAVESAATVDAFPTSAAIPPRAARPHHSQPSGTAYPTSIVPLPQAGGDGGRHDMRLALIARFLPALPESRIGSALPDRRKLWMAVPPAAETAPPAAGQPFWMRRQMAGWTLGSWVYLRSGANQMAGGGAPAGQLGGSQAGVRLAYGFGDTGRLRTYGRATIALAETRQRELALGLAFAPVAGWPVDIAAERRVAAGSRGRTAFAAMVVGGVSDVALPHGFRLEAYGQAGVVGARRRDAFVDAVVVVDREVARIPDASLHLGALAAGAAQPGVARGDVGPRLTLRLPNVGEGSRVALDWRQRVAGEADPRSGLALTLAADF